MSNILLDYSNVLLDIDYIFATCLTTKRQSKLINVIKKSPKRGMEITIKEIPLRQFKLTPWKVFV